MGLNRVLTSCHRTDVSSLSHLCRFFQNSPVFQLFYLGKLKTIDIDFHLRLDQSNVIIKVLRNPHPNFRELVQFRNQYLITRHLAHPHILCPLSLEVYKNSYALIMPDGGEIALTEYRHQASNSLDIFLKIAQQLAEALQYLHQQGIIHKDIKPANILIHPQTGDIKLIDFSIATLLPKEQQQLLNPNVLEGTLAYISPEQTGRMNRGIDYRTDFYGLGVTFFQLLTGELPFQSHDPKEQKLAELNWMAGKKAKTATAYPAAMEYLTTGIALLPQNAWESDYQQLTGSVYNAERLKGVPESQRDRAEYFHFYVNQMILAYLFAQPVQAVEATALAETYLDGGLAQFPFALYAFYDALIQLMQYEKATAKQQTEILARVQQQQEKLQHWATLAPANHQHRWELVTAESYRVLKDYHRALEYYEQGIKNANQHHFIQDEGLANERLAKCYLDWGKEKVAAVYIQEAYYCYSRWGAKAKVEELERLYPN